MGYGGFYRLRCDIAGVFGEKFKKLYVDWIDRKYTIQLPTVKTVGLRTK